MLKHLRSWILYPIQLLMGGTPKAAGVVIFLACCWIYLANDQSITSNDNVPSAILALNWLEHGVLHFDLLRDSYFYEAGTGGDTPYFFVEAPNGHLTSTYPIGTAIVTFPIYFVSWIIIRTVEMIQGLLTGSPVDGLNLLDQAFQPALYQLQKYAATIVAAFSVVLFYWAVRLKFTSPVVALLSTFIFAFCTTTWMISSQGLWQHGASNLVVLALFLTLLKANRVGPSRRKRLLFLVGVLCGLLPGIRPTSVIYGVGAIAYVLITYPREIGYLVLGLPSALFSAGWNFYFFGFDLKYFLVGGYSRFASDNTSFTAQYYILTWNQFKAGFLGSLVSPSRGLLIFSPVVLLAIPGLWAVVRRPRQNDETLTLVMTGAAILLFIQYCFFTVWSGGWTYGPRYMTDLLPVLCWLIAYGLHEWVGHRPNFQAWKRSLGIGLLGLLMGLSLFPQVVGAFSPRASWDAVPHPGPERLWQWHDSQILRHTRGLYSRIQDPIGDEDDYLAGVDGLILALQNRPGTPLPHRLIHPPGRPLRLTAVLKNTGQKAWLGYESGLARGITVLELRLYAPGRPQPVLKGRLYGSGYTKPGETSIAIGEITTPKRPGRYRITLNLSVIGLGDPPGQTPEDVYELELIVRQHTQKPPQKP